MAAMSLESSVQLDAWTEPLPFQAPTLALAGKKSQSAVLLLARPVPAR